MSDLDELARVNPDIVGVRGAVCAKGEREEGVYWESVAEFKRQVDLRKSGEVDVLDGAVATNGAATNGASDWTVIDGTGKTCAGILAALEEHIGVAPKSYVEVIIPDVLNTYDVIVWAERGSHEVLTQRRDENGSLRMLIKP
jgi:hypothetical protein